MSPSWRDRWVVRIGEDAVSAARYPAGWRLGEPRRATVACAVGSGVDGMMAALDQVLMELTTAPAAKTRRSRMPVHVVVSNRLVRYALAPGLGSLRRPAERRLAAESALASLYGEPAEPWSVVLGEAPGDSDAVAAGMPQSLVAGTLERCEVASLDVVSFEPQLAASFGALQRAMAGPASSDAGWIALAEPEHLLVARLEGGRLTLLRNQRLRGPVEQELPVWLDRLTMAQGLPAGPAPVIVASAQVFSGLEGRSASYGYRFVAVAPEGRLPGGAAA